MHPCLAVPEIVSDIAEEIAADGDRGPSPWATLASFALTCRVISEPALDSLWKVQSSLVPLLQTMPSDLWGKDPAVLNWIVGNIHDAYAQLTICRPIVPADWSRFHIYAPRIRHFIDWPEGKRHGVPNPGDTYPNPESLQALALARPMDAVSFCPQVRSLDWEILVDNTDGTLSCMALFMGAATMSVALDMSNLALPGLSSALSIISNFPTLQRVDIKSYPRRHFGYPDSTMEAAHLLEFFSQGRRLRSIDLDDPLPRTIAVLFAGFVHLTRLVIAVNDEYPTYQTSGFQALEFLNITSKGLLPANSFIRMLKSPLRTLRICVEGGPNPSSRDIAETFEAISAHCLHTHLRSLAYISRLQMHENSLPIGEDIIRPLLDFKHLSTLELRAKLPIRLGDEAVREMATTWPQLSCLILGRGGWRQNSSVTPAGLLPLLRLHGLSELHIAIDATTVNCPPQSGAVESAEGTSQIRILNFQDSAISDASWMAAFLSKHAPRIEEALSWDNKCMQNSGLDVSLVKEYSERWEEVGRLMDVRNKEKMAG
ncbi:hypothetical protein HWV62_37867 [Athelia sp. TMB]|nr:hypothetical protein HWV62_37867 [Athelia sp. TMB]